MAIPVQT